MENLTVDRVLDSIRERHSLKSDYAVCKMLDISGPLVSGWRHGKSLPDERMCQKLAGAAGIDPLVLTASMQAQRSKTTEARTMWEAIAERLQMAVPGVVAAFFAVVIASVFLADDADAVDLAAGQAYVTNSVGGLYIVSTGWTLICVILLWLAGRFDPTFRPCFVPAK